MKFQAIREFQQAVERDPELNTLFERMIEEALISQRQSDAGSDPPSIKNTRQLFSALGKLLSRAPKYENGSLLVGCPVSDLLSEVMSTPSGSVVFLNYHLKKILNQWSIFLQSPASCHFLTDDPNEGWFGEKAMRKMPGFAVQFKCDATKPHYGFRSWDHFFTREFREGMRAISAADNDRVIVHACESAPYKIQFNVQFRDSFQIKSGRYSLSNMLEDDIDAALFVGGTVYQAYLSSTNYHRWHSPVSGITKAYVKEGAYFSHSPSIGYDKRWLSQQTYVSHIATRVAVFIQADNEDIGLMVFLGVGMGEVSSCQMTVERGQYVKKGQQIGMFHFGGSTYCLLFRPKVKIEFHIYGQTPGPNSTNLPINSLLATV